MSEGAWASWTVWFLEALKREMMTIVATTRLRRRKREVGVNQLAMKAAHVVMSEDPLAT